ncbi:cytochrome b-c1 complex subunit Rieske-4, mitochondrial-like isoform X2 [Gossypium raimondii]|uniref:cytochrome b-c1 complex subunit Rieske-4, mitochondrial-like isoform X2 n=1 Tax=Gossypium raimondii TaxID=29730 RepID=UPI00227A7A0D|nr:cytochrome b-c1 complex subunit Rieske-4, mitochondrial-like isoform X2 [Gossypium raimondii]
MILADALSRRHDMGMILDVPTTVAAVKNPTSKIVYDEYNRKRFPPSDPSKRAFAYFVLSGGMFVLSMSARKDILTLASLEVNLSSIELGSTGDILAPASLEVNLSSIELGSTVTVKWRGKPLFIKRRTEEDIKTANSVDLASQG